MAHMSAAAYQVIRTNAIEGFPATSSLLLKRVTKKLWKTICELRN